LVNLAVLNPAGRSCRQPKEILVAPFCGESLFLNQLAVSFIKRSMFIESSSGSTSLSNSR